MSAAEAPANSGHAIRVHMQFHGAGLDVMPDFQHKGNRQALATALNANTDTRLVDETLQVGILAFKKAMDGGGDEEAGARAAWLAVREEVLGDEGDVIPHAVFESKRANDLARWQREQERMERYAPEHRQTQAIMVRQEQEPLQERRTPSAADVLSTAQLMQMEFADRKNIIGEFWPYGGHGAITAREGIGKTTLDMVLARDLANGVPPLPGWPVPRRQKVVYCDMEQPLEQTQRKFRDVNGTQPLPENLLWLSAETLEPYGGLDLGTADGKQIFMNIMDEVQADVAIVDTVVYAFQSHNPAFEATDAADFCRLVAALRLRHHAVLWSAHTSKAGDKSTMYGSVIQNYPLDWSINLEAGAEPGRLTMRFTKTRWIPPQDRELELEILWRPDGVHLRSLGPAGSLDLRLMELVHAADPPLRSINALLEAAKTAGVSKSKGTVQEVVRKYRLKGFMAPDDPLRLSKPGREVFHFDE